MKIVKNIFLDKVMIFMMLFTLILYALNLRLALNIERFNPIEKSMWLILVIIILLRGNFNRIALYYILAFFILCHVMLMGVAHELFSYSVFVLSLTQIPIVLLLCSSHYKMNVLKTILIFFSLMPFFVFFVGVLYEFANISTLFAVEYATDILRLRGSSSAAYLASWCIASIYSSMKLVQMEENMKYYGITLFSFIILYFTVARVPLFISLVLAAYVFYCSSPYISKKIKTIVTILGVVFSIFVLIFLSDKYTSRIEGSGGSGREMIWDFLLYDYETNLKPWGAGFGHQYIIIPEDIVNLTNTVAAHNEYIRLLVELGGVGSFVFWLGFYSFFIVIFIKSKSNYRGEMLLALFLFSFFSYFDNTIATPAIFSFMYLVFATNNSVINKSFRGLI